MPGAFGRCSSARGRRAWGSRCIMVNRNLLSQIDQNELNDEVDALFPQVEPWYVPEEKEFEVNKIVTGQVVNLVGDDVVVDVGYKSEGIIPMQEWYDEGLDKIVEPQIGDPIEVLLEAVEDE